MTLQRDGETAIEGSISSSDDRKDALHQELDATKEQLLSVQRNHEELEARSKADLPILVKEVKALRNSENNSKIKLSEYLEEKSKFEKLLEEDREANGASRATLEKLLQDCETICKILEESAASSVGAGNEMEPSVGKTVEMLASSDDLVGLIREQANLLAELDRAGSGEEATSMEDGLRKILASIIIHAAMTKVQANSVLHGQVRNSTNGESGQ